MSELAVGMIGTRFMGRAHSNAWGQVARFFDVPLRPALHTVAGRHPQATQEFAERWGWQHASTDPAALVRDPAIGLVDICTPNDAHRDSAIGALEAGKHVACEKPLAATLTDARAMAAAAAAASGRTFVWFSYRRVPAIALARELVLQGRIGAVRHVRATYLSQWGQDAGDVWRFDASVAGSGALGDIAAHIVDTVQFVTGEPVSRVAGALSKTFVPSHTVDDAVLFIGELAGGATASFEASRFSVGHHNTHGFEIHGERGALRFQFDEMGRLGYYDGSTPAAVRGWTTIEVGDAAAGHPWVGSWWPPGHPIGYEHTFTHQAADILSVLGGREPVAPIPDFADALQVQTVLETAAESARRAAAVDVAEIAAG
ncbi:MAG: Gfo/Idh/MocA family oxidoreductase [Kineosporiaceae bacterium]